MELDDEELKIAVLMRLRGESWKVVADYLGYSIHDAKKAVDRFLSQALNS